MQLLRGGSDSNLARSSRDAFRRGNLHHGGHGAEAAFEDFGDACWRCGWSWCVASLGFFFSWCGNSLLPSPLVWSRRGLLGAVASESESVAALAGEEDVAAGGAGVLAVGVGKREGRWSGGEKEGNAVAGEVC